MLSCLFNFFVLLKQLFYIKLAIAAFNPSTERQKETFSYWRRRAKSINSLAVVRAAVATLHWRHCLIASLAPVNLTVLEWNAKVTNRKLERMDAKHFKATIASQASWKELSVSPVAILDTATVTEAGSWKLVNGRSFSVSRCVGEGQNGEQSLSKPRHEGSSRSKASGGERTRI